MLEGVVQSLLLGYLGSYVKNIQREQLKIGLWKGEVLLENVELNLEAFDNLQFPLSLKQGQVGRLSIKIPWKKLGWDPIIISLENVFIRACQRDDTEWSLGAVERREYAVKKARLDAAEVAKLTRRVSGGVSETKIGQTFVSYITAKILDGIQVSIRDIHFIYTNKQSDPEQFVFGLQLSYLTMKGSYSGKLVDNEVHKIVEVSRLGVYCNTSHGEISDVIDPQLFCSARFDSNNVNYILLPCDVALSLVVNRSGQVEDGVPQYSIRVELTTLVLQLNEIQLQQIFNLWDYLGTCHLREKYGRFRPCFTSLQKKPHGWQKMWWQYAQESVLSDIRKRLRKTSWRYLGWRISYRKNYVSLYKKVIRQAQHVDKDILLELEQMEREIDVDDILTYRSIAERESQEFLLSSTLSNVGRYSAAARQQNDDGSSAKAQRGWINLLSLGMLGAGGTEDSIQFSGVVSDEIVKDIYEVTQFHPTNSPGGGAFTKNGIFLLSIKFKVHQINATLLSKTSDREITKIIFDSVDTVFKFWEESWNARMLVSSVEMDDLCTGKAILISQMESANEHFMIHGRPFITLEVDVSTLNHEPEMSIKVVVEPFEITYELEFFLHFWELYLVLDSFQFHSKRVTSSLNSFEDVNVRLSSKAECIFSNRTKVNCNASFSTVILRAPWRYEGSEFIMVLEFGSLFFESKKEAESSTSVGEEQISVGSTLFGDTAQGLLLRDLYESFDIVLSDVEVNIMQPNCQQTTSIVERFNASVILSSCIIPDEPAFNKLEVHLSLSSVCVHFSPSIYGALLGFCSFLDQPIMPPEPLREEPKVSALFKFSADVKCAGFHVTITDDADNSVILILALGDVDILCVNQEAIEVWLSIKTLGISTCNSEGESSSYTLCSSRAPCQSASEIGVSVDGSLKENVTPEGCVLLHYQVQRSLPIVCQEYRMYVTDLDFHIYPDIVGRLVKFFDLLTRYGPASSPDSFKKLPAYNSKVKDLPMKSGNEFQNFGFSNFYEDGTSGAEGIPFDLFPFVTICNSGFIGSLGLPSISSIPEWRRKCRVREGQLERSPKMSFSKRSGVVGFLNSKLLSVADTWDEHGGSYNADIHLIELNLNSVNVYFHDSSCILATLTLPLCKSFISQDAKCLDVLCTVDGLLLSSSWVSQDICEFLWGHSDANISPILNIRVRKQAGGSLNQEVEVSISAQHVCCVLPSEFLAILIGYFSLPDWSPHASQKHVSDIHKERDTVDSGVKWNVEILDSRLAIPVERNKNQSLHVGLRQLYFSFTTMSHKRDALKDIPRDCMVPEQKVADSTRLLNIFGRNISLSLVLREDEKNVLVKDNEVAEFKVSLISSADIDLWIRIPCEGRPSGNHVSSTCIMTMVDNCQIIAEDAFLLIGLDALLAVINEFSTVGRESESFKSDVLQFLQRKEILKESAFICSPVPSSATFSEVQCCVKSLSVKLKQSRLTESIPSEFIASLDMQFQFSASFRDDVPLCMDIRFARLSLHSFRSSVNLVQCMSSASVSSCFDIHFAKSNSGVNEVLVELPSAHIWLYILDWNDVLELLMSYSEKLSQTSFMNAQTHNSNSVTSELRRNDIIPVIQNELESPRLSSSTVCINMEDSVELLVRSERIGLLLHYPLFVNNEETLHKSKESENNKETTWNFSSNKYDEAAILNRHPQYVTLVVRSKDIEISNAGNHIKFSCCVEEASGMLDRIKDERVLSWSVFQLLHVTVVAIYEKHKMRHTAEILVDSFDLSVSNQLFSVWPTLGLQIPESDSSESPLMSMDLKVQFRNASLLLTDSTCSCNGPILEILLRNMALHTTTTGSAMKTTLHSDLLVNYFNLQKVMWEPFIETWSFLLNITRTHKQCSHLNSVVVTDFHLTSTTRLNLNFTEPMIEVIFRLNEMIKGLWGPAGFNDLIGAQRFIADQVHDSIYTRRYAPFILQNETSLPLLFHVYRGVHKGDDSDILSVKERITVYPGSSVPIYTDETPAQQIFRFVPSQSSDRLKEKKSFGVIHHMISVQLDGTSGPSMPISMDTIGRSYFEVNFSKALENEVEKNDDAFNCKRKVEVKNKTDSNNGFVVPVVLDVSSLHYKKLIRVYSTVVLLNTTSITLELRFDTPFGVSPKVLDQIYPGQEFKMPLHLAEAGRLRWRPLGTGFLWSEAHMFSRGRSEETKLGSFRSFVCYPSHPSSDPFRCCLSIQLINISPPCEQKPGSSFRLNDTLKHSVGNSEQNANYRLNSRKPSIHYVTLVTPLSVRNFMPSEMSLTIESGGVTHTVLISEVEHASFFHIDSSHDLDLVFHVHGFGPRISKFPRAEAFVAVARFHDNKFSQTETLTFYPDSSNGPIYVTVEKTMDALCGAREVCVFVPFLLYNCTGLPITVADLGHEMEGCTMPPCYHLIEMDQHLGRIQSPILFSSKQDSYANRSDVDNILNTSKKHSNPITENDELHPGRYINSHVISADPLTCFLDQSGYRDPSFHRALDNLRHPDTSKQSQFLRNGEYGYDPLDFESRKVKACMYFPHSSSSASELMVRLSICMPTLFTDNKKNSMWSSPFYLVPASGSTCVVVPQTNTSGAFIVSVTSSPLAGPFSGRTRAIIFQPRYVIINACSKDLCYKQKGAESVFHLGIGQHSHLHWADPTSELLVSLVFNEPGWLWSGSFYPDHVGDTQVKMRNYVRGELSLIRVEVQNADVSIRDEKILGTPNGNSGTLLILLSDDKTGFMPYRIDNFSKERLRIYQEKCKTFETTIHSYMSCPYTWDEPCFPHHLVVEVLGERILGSYSLDEVTEQLPIYLASTSEKPGRQLFLNVRSDGAVKVLSIMDSSNLPNDLDSGLSVINEKGRFDQKEEIIVDYCERISIHLPLIGVSLIQSSLQELLYVSAKDTRIDLIQSAEQQKISFQILSLQVDNQLHNTAYPVMLSLDYDYGGNSVSQIKNKDDKIKMNNETILDGTSERACQPIIFLSAVKGRNKESSLVFFEYIMLRLAPLHIELEEEVVSCLFDYFRNVVSMMQRGGLPCLDSTVNSMAVDTGCPNGLSVHAPHYESLTESRRHHFPMSVSKYLENCQSNPSLPSVVPIEDFWQQIYFLARKQNKIYVEVFHLAPIRLTLSFSSAPWMHRNEGPTTAEYPRPISGTAFQRLMALADVEGAPVNLKQLYIAHHMGTSDSFHEILIRHYTPQLLHEMYKIFGSASVIGNPMGFAKNLGLGIKDFLSVPATGIFKNPSGLFTGMAKGSSSLFYSTVYAISSAATQFSKSVHKSIVAFTFDDRAVSTMEKQWTSLASHSKGVLNEFLEGLTGFLQSPIQGAEKHGIPGFLSGVALGTAGLVARPVAGILEVTGRTAQSIRNRSLLHRPHRYRVRFPRPLSRECPLQPYSWEEAIGISILLKADGAKFKDEIFVTCKTLKQTGRFLVITERLVMVVVCSSLVAFGTPEFHGIADPQWVIEVELSLNNVIYAGREVAQVNIVGINWVTPLRQHQHRIGIRRTTLWIQSNPLPLFQMMSIEFAREEEADNVLQVLLSTIAQTKEQASRALVLHRSNLR